MTKRLNLNIIDAIKVGNILADLEAFDLDFITDAIVQAMEVEQGHDRDIAYRIADLALKTPEQFLALAQ